MVGSTKGLKEAFARFFEDPSREGFVICLGTTSERPTSSTSREWLEAPKLARHVLGRANFDGGGLTAINKHFMGALNAPIEHAQGEQALWEPARA